MSETDRNSVENILLLCPSCHTLIDKAAAQYPPSLLLAWKADHRTRIEAIFKTPQFDSRQDLLDELSKLLAANNAIFATYGPESPAAINPMSDAVVMWNMRVLDTIIPNNRRISALFERNSRLMTEKERELVNKFKIHQQGFEYNHISDDVNPAVPRFPSDIYSL